MIPFRTLLLVVNPVMVLYRLVLNLWFPMLTLAMFPRCRALANPRDTRPMLVCSVLTLLSPRTVLIVCRMLLCIGSTVSKMLWFLARIRLTPLPSACPWQPLNLVRRWTHPLRYLVIVVVKLGVVLSLAVLVTALALLRGLLDIPV